MLLPGQVCRQLAYGHVKLSTLRKIGQTLLLSTWTKATV